MSSLSENNSKQTNKMTENQNIQRLFRMYKKETNQQFVDAIEFAKWLEKRGWEMPTPPTALELLEKKIKDALREETRRDAKTGREYKVNLSFNPGDGQGAFLVDVDEAPRHVIHKCLKQRRDQTAGDVYQMVLIEDHWNDTHPNEEPIHMPRDYEMDVQIKKHTEGGEEPLSTG
jgi:hypothetical protein